MGSVKTWLAAAALCAAAASTWASGAQDLLSTLDRAAQPAPEPSVTVRLVAQNEGLTPQAENLLAVVLEHAPGWHTYWRMPGDAGLTTQFSFTTPKDVRLTDPRFPLPERHNDKGIVSFSYGGTAVFPFEAEIPRFPEGRSARISIHVSYLACKDVCIPGEGTAEITLPYEVAPKPSADAELVSNAIVNVPEVADIRGVRAVYEEDRLKVTVPASEVHVEKSLSFYPLDERVLKLSDEPQHQTEDPDFTHGTANLDNHAIISSVCKQNITSISKYTIIKLVFLAIRDQCLDFSRIFRHCKILCRPANAKCRMLAHRLLLQYFNLFYLQTHTFLTKINIKKPISSALS